MRFSRPLLILVLFSLLLSACQPAAQTPAASADSRWIDNATFYEIFVRSFSDSNGDGIGDFNGITQKLDYLKSLGISGIWLMPVFPSPSYHGYDVTDYKKVNPDYGGIDDFVAMLAKAHQLGIRVILDLPINHTSNQHPRFVASAKGDPKYKDYYIWKNSDPGYKGPWNETVWHELNGRFYYGIFVPEMPDLNYLNPAVTEEMREVARYWIQEIGIDGFRIDGARHLIEEGQVQENTAKTHAWYKEFQSYIKGLRADAVTVGEVWTPSEQAAPYVNNHEFDRVFNFPLATAILTSVNVKDGGIATKSLIQQSQIYTGGRYAPFLTNHDQRRAMSELNGDVNKAKAAASILLTAPGTPFIYYGEEIGMSGDKPDPMIRTPMQWTAGENAGFTSGKPWEAINADFPQVNASAQDADPNSLLNHYRKLVAARNQQDALRNGQYIPVISGVPALFAALRATEKEAVLVLVNLDAAPVKNPSLSWAGSSLAGALKTTVIFGQGTPAAPQLNGRGGIENYQPVPEIPGNSTILIHLAP